jgi:hypothetical protein
MPSPAIVGPTWPKNVDPNTVFGDQYGVQWEYGEPRSRFDGEGGTLAIAMSYADEANGWDASVVLVHSGLDGRSYWTPEEARAMASRLIEQAVVVEATRSGAQEATDG